MEVVHRYVKQRKQFGRHPHFQDKGSELLLDLRPNEEHAKAWMARPQVAAAVQAAPDMSEHEVNTVAVVTVNRGMSHLEGGWPKEVDPTEAEQVVRFRRKVEKDEDYVATVVRLGAVVEGLIKQNNAIDIYEDYFADLPPQHLSEPPSAKTLTILRDPAAVRRGAQALSWHPDSAIAKLAVAYSVFEFQRCSVPGMPTASYVWDLSSPGAPEATLAAPVPLVTLAYNLKDHNLVGGGQYNGQVALFDLRRGPAPADATPVAHSHRDAVHAIAWTQSKTGSELMSTSTDGSVLWWDLRKLGEPLETLTLRDGGGGGGGGGGAAGAAGGGGGGNGGGGMIQGGMCLEYSPQAGPAKFMVGTQQGAVLAGNRKAKTPTDRISGSYTGHHGAVCALSRSPFFPKYFLSVADWMGRVWNEDVVRSPVLTTPYGPTYLTGGAWSPSRPGLFFLTTHQGALEAWDLYCKQREPVLRMHVADNRPLTAFAVQAGAAAAGAAAAAAPPHWAGVGCVDGSVTILQLSQGLVEPQDNEKAATLAMLERETSREKGLERNAKEARAKARKEAARTAEPLDSVTDEDLAQLEREFFAMTTGGALAQPPGLPIPTR